MINIKGFWKIKLNCSIILLSVFYKKTTKLISTNIILKVQQNYDLYHIKEAAKEFYLQIIFKRFRAK